MLETRKKRWTSMIMTLGVLLVGFSASLAAQNHPVRTGGARSRGGYDRSRQFMTGRQYHRALVQRPFAVRNQSFVHRTYIGAGVRSSHIYRPFVWRGISMNVYAPGRYYSPEFYGWAYSPWGAPVAYRWGWTGSPWFVRSGGYFRPFPVYTSASLWLTDYLLAETLQKGYRENPNAAAAGGSSAITPFVKHAIANEIRRQLALANAERQAMANNSLADAGSSGIARMLGDNIAHVFVAASDLTVFSRGQECTLSAGDVLQLHGPQAPGASDASLLVLASKGQGCRQSSVVQVPIQDLQEMHNHMRATLDRGLVELQSRRGGLPAPPAAAMTTPLQPAFATQAPVGADKTEQDAVSQALAPADTVTPVPAAAEETATISLGQTTEQVVAILAAPRHIAELGTKQLYIYSNLKITFVGGKVSDVQ